MSESLRRNGDTGEDGSSEGDVDVDVDAEADAGVRADILRKSLASCSRGANCCD